MTATAITIADQTVEAELHAQGLEHQVEQMAANRKYPAEVVERARARVPVAWAIVDTLKGVAGQGRARA